MPSRSGRKSRMRRRRLRVSFERAQTDSEEMTPVGGSPVQAEETKRVGESSVQAEETRRVGESSVQEEEMRRLGDIIVQEEEMGRAINDLKKWAENRRRKERRKRSKQLQKQNNSELNFPPSPTLVPCGPEPLTTDTVKSERIIYEPFDFSPFLTLQEDDPARNEYIEQHAGLLDMDSSGHLRLDLMDPDKEFYLIPCLLHPGQPKYYRRLIVNNMCTRKFNYVESEDSDLDRQYVRFYSRLEEGIKDLVPTWVEFLNRCFEEAKNNEENVNRRVYEAEALRIAEETEFSKLETSDIYNCIMDLIQEKSLVKDRLEFSREFHRCLLECGYGEDEEISDKYLSWRHGEQHPLSEAYEMLDYKEWLAQPGIRQMEKDGKYTELMKYHDNKLKEDTSTRIRYLKLKLELAERLGLVPKEAGTN